jgi:hypothetical protein
MPQIVVILVDLYVHQLPKLFTLLEIKAGPYTCMCNSSGERVGVVLSVQKIIAYIT